MSTQKSLSLPNRLELPLPPLPVILIPLCTVSALWYQFSMSNSIVINSTPQVVVLAIYFHKDFRLAATNPKVRFQIRRIQVSNTPE